MLRSTVGFRREINHGVGARLQRLRYYIRVANVTLQEAIARVLFQTLEIFQVAGISEFVQIHHVVIRIAVENVPDEVAANEACPSRDQQTQAQPSFLFQS